MTDIHKFAEEHQAGAGYTDSFIRRENPSALLDLQIPTAALEAALDPVATRCDQVYTGYSTYRELCENTAAYLATDRIILFYNSKGDVVNNIWLTLDFAGQPDVDAALALLAAVAPLGSLLPADWGWQDAILLEDTETRKGTLSALCRAFTQWEENHD